MDKETQREDAWQPLYFVINYCMIDYMSDEVVQLILRFLINGHIFFFRVHLCKMHIV